MIGGLTILPKHIRDKQHLTDQFSWSDIHDAHTRNPALKKAAEEMESLTGQEIQEVQEIDDRISRLQTSFLIDEAQRYLLQ